METQMKPYAGNCDRAGQRGSMLLEALIAILIFSMGILAIVGLQAASVKFTTDAKFRTDASMLASQTLGQMWVDWANIPSYNGTTQPATDVTTPASTVLPNGSRTISVTGNDFNGYVIKITIDWNLPGESTSHQYVTATEMHARCMDALGKPC
jgi:type IV pilus assembly protein PilV